MKKPLLLFVATVSLSTASALCIAYSDPCEAVTTDEPLELVDVIPVSDDAGDPPAFLEADATLVFDGSGAVRMVEFEDRDIFFAGGR